MWLPWYTPAIAQQVTFEVSTHVPAGTDPALVVHADVPGTLTIGVTCGERRYDWKGAVGAGFTHRLALTGLPGGDTSCVGQARLDAPDGGWAESPLSFTVSIVGPLRWTVADADWDRERRRLVVHPSRPLAEARAVVRGADGRELEIAYARLDDPSQPVFELSTREEIVQILVTGTDPAGFTSELELSPWYYAIPHEDVVFATGSAEIRPSEVPKLETCWADVQAVLARYGKVVRIQLFVAGYTDTVGDAAGNLELSRRRARAIAAWFRSRGFPGEVAWQGFGEEVLAVATADETDEARNRRALYVVAAETPPIGPDLPRADWSR